LVANFIFVILNFNKKIFIKAISFALRIVPIAIGTASFFAYYHEAIGKKDTVKSLLKRPKNLNKINMQEQKLLFL
jgi:hypothetical protein